MLCKWPRLQRNQWKTWTNCMDIWTACFHSLCAFVSFTAYDSVILCIFPIRFGWIVFRIGISIIVSTIFLLEFIVSNTSKIASTFLLQLPIWLANPTRLPSNFNISYVSNDQQQLSSLQLLFLIFRNMRVCIGFYWRFLSHAQSFRHWNSFRIVMQHIRQHSLLSTKAINSWNYPISCGN